MIHTTFTFFCNRRLPVEHGSQKSNRSFLASPWGKVYGCRQNQRTQLAVRDCDSIVVLMYDICSVTKKHVRIYIYMYMQTCTRLQDSSWKEGATPFSIFHVTFWSNTPLWVNNFPLKKQLLLQGIPNDLAWIWPYLLADEAGFCTWHTLYMFIFENATLWIRDLVQWSHRSNQIHRSTRKSRLVLL